MIPKSIRKQLPKSNLLKFEIGRRFYFAKFRMANATKWQVGPIAVVHRSRWLERPARALYPQLFRGEK